MGTIRECVLYRPEANYIVTMNTADWKVWSVLVESVTEGVKNPDHGPRQITTTGTPPSGRTLHDYVELFLNDRHPNIKPEWSRYSKSNFGYHAAAQRLLNDWGYDLTREMLEDGRAPHIVNMFGSLGATIEVLDELHSCQKTG